MARGIFRDTGQRGTRNRHTLALRGQLTLQRLKQSTSLYAPSLGSVRCCASDFDDLPHPSGKGLETAAMAVEDHGPSILDVPDNSGLLDA